MARRRLKGRPRYTRLDWVVTEDMWDETGFDLPMNSSVLLWNIGPSADEKFWTVKRIKGMMRFSSSSQGTTNMYWWVVKGILDSGGVFATRFDTPFDSAQAEDSFLDWRHFLLPANDITPTTVDVPFYTHADISTQRTLKYPEQIGLLVWSTAASEAVRVVNFHRALVARP